MSGLTIVILGLSITSSWGNGHATTYRSLVKELSRRGHHVTFLERDVPWYGGAHRDMPEPPFGQTFLYVDYDDLTRRFAELVHKADLVILGSYVPEGTRVARWMLKTASGVTAFYDIDTPITVAKLTLGDEEYLSATEVPLFDIYLSFAGGPLLERIRRDFGARHIGLLYCSVDPELYYPEETAARWDLGYLGTYSADRQPKLELLLLGPARARPESRFVVAGPQYPEDIAWPANVQRIEHLPPHVHRAFYNAQRFTLNVTRAEMTANGWSPSVRLFEAAACGVPIISDDWEGLETVFTPGTEILIASSSEEVAAILADLGEEQRRAIATAARRRVLRAHTAAIRAQELEAYVHNIRAGAAPGAAPGADAAGPQIRRQRA
jgi:spore maturation protein CgeB